MKLCRFDDDSGYVLFNDEGLAFAVKPANNEWWETYQPIPLSRDIRVVDDVPEGEADRLIADYCAWRLCNHD